MTDIPAIPLEAVITGYSKRADGGVNLRVKLHPHGLPPAVHDWQLGDRLILAVVRVDEQEQPIPEKAPVQAIPLNAPAQRSCSAQARGLPQRVGMLCNDIRFQRWLSELKGVDFDDTADWVRDYCGVKSRAEILPGTDAEQAWNFLESAYLAENK